jgi:hypothetical protein
MIEFSDHGAHKKKNLAVRLKNLTDFLDHEAQTKKNSRGATQTSNLFYENKWKSARIYIAYANEIETNIFFKKNKKYYTHF